MTPVSDPPVSIGNFANISVEFTRYNLPFLKKNREQIRKVIERVIQKVPWKSGLPPKWISCSSRAVLDSTSMDLPCFWKISGVSFFSLLHLRIIATKVEHIKAMTNEDRRSRSATQEGVVSLEALEAFFWEGTKI